MPFASHWRARTLGAGLFLANFAFGFGAVAQDAGGAKPDAASCEAREIAVAIRGCTALIEGAAPGDAKLTQALIKRGKAYAKRSYYSDAVADFSRAIELDPKNAKAYLERGRAYDELADKSRAEADLAEAMRLDPADPEAYASRGWLRQNSGDKEAAKADFEQTIKLADGAIEARRNPGGAYYARADAYAGIEDCARAISDLEDAIELNPREETYYADRGAVYSLKGEYDKAAADYAKALELQPEYWRGLSLRGGLSAARFDYDKAIADATAGIKLNKRNAQAYANRGYYYRSKKDFAHAVADIGEAIRLLPNSANAYANRGWAYLGQKDYEHALADFKRTLELNPKIVGARNGIGQIYIAQKDFPQAIAEYDALIAADPSSANYTMRGQAYKAMGTNDKAIADFSEAIRLKPDNRDALGGRQLVYSKIGDTEKQIADLKELIKLLPDEDTYYITLSQAYRKVEDNDRAISVLDQFIRKKPDSAFAYQVRANFYSGTGEFDKAIADANQVIRLTPDDPEGYSYRAMQHFAKGDFDNAIADLTQAIRLNPDKAASDYWQRASARNVKGDYVHAIEDTTHAIQLAPNIENEELRQMVLESAYALRAMSRSNVGDTENSLADYNEAVKLAPNNADAFASRGQFYFWQAQYEAAIQDFDKALQLDAKEWVSRSTKALALLQLGRIEEASKEVEIGLRSGANRDAYLAVRGAIAYEQGKYARAADDLSEAINLSRYKKPANYMRRGQAYEKLGQKALAMADYTAAIELNVPNSSQRDARVVARERLGVLQGESVAEKQQPAQTQTQKAQPVDPGRRIALVIGIGAYQNAPALRNPPNDAAAVAKALRELGFNEVTELLDPTRASLEAALMAFSDKAADADWAVVFYAGHGMQVDGHNHLIPTDAKLENDRHVDFETVVLDKVIESMSGTKKLGLVILDACRDNPFLKRMKQTRSVRSFGQGLAAVEPGQGQMIVYATKDGSVAEDGEDDHSPFTKALLLHIHEARLDIRLMFSKVRDAVLQSTGNRQQPFTYGSLPGEGLFFKVAEK